MINFDNRLVDENSIKKMMLKIKHRGPDDEGLFLDQNIGLGFVRLSILDLSPLGHQPMLDDSGRYVIVHNGEVYNYIEIRDELLSKGYLFRSNTDTEVILKAYLEWGEDCLHRFNGMWAFCIYDTFTKELFCARDRYGVKPFYYYKDDGKFVFASEIPAILSVLNRKPEPNFQAIFDYLVFNRTDQNQNTFFSEIGKLPHGHYIKTDQKSFKLIKWYDLRKSVSGTEGFKDEEEYKNLFSSAVALRLRSDVPVGVCLSGGLDSSSIVSILLKEFQKPDINTFSAIYNKDEKGDESDFINLFKGEVENMYFTTPDLSSLLENLTHFVSAHAEPIPSTSPFAQFNVMKLAKQHVVVTLDGQGADECLAGYHYFYGLYFKDLLLSFKIIKLSKEIFKYLSLHKSAYGLTTFLFFLLPSFLRIKLRTAKNPYVMSGFVSKYSKNSQISEDLYGANSLRDSLINHFE
ncbi:MAG: asparagine synthase (glutamine-hydrolyzing), partial [Chlorobiota bacterium]